MELGISGKVALVVGASKNIGRAVAEILAMEGCQIVAIARDRAALKSIAVPFGRNNFFYDADLQKEGEPARLVKWLREMEAVPDIIVHALGGSNGITDPWGSADDYAKVWRLNMGIAHDINRAFMPAMIAKGWGRIVHFSSVATTANIGYVPYASAKHAVEGYVKNISKEVSRHGVIVSAVRPGAFPYPGRYLADLPAAEKAAWIAEHIPQRRYGEAAECARVVAFLCSENASYMAGAVVAVDGGHR